MSIENDRVLLLVEDDPADARLIQRALDKVDIPAQVIHLWNGDEAVAYFASEGQYADRERFPLPWLVLLDIKLPRRSGLEVLKWIREQGTPISATPVVIFSSSSHTADVDLAYRYGVNSYLVKPETSAQLAGMLTTLKSYWFLYNAQTNPQKHGAAT